MALVPCHNSTKELKTMQVSGTFCVQRHTSSCKPAFYLHGRSQRNDVLSFSIWKQHCPLIALLIGQRKVTRPAPCQCGNGTRCPVEHGMDLVLGGTCKTTSASIRCISCQLFAAINQ